MASAEAVARYFLWLAASEPEEEPVTHMRLQKLLYYAQGWSLASRGQPLFEGEIQAWQHGPVVREVYPVFAEYRAGPIAASESREPKELSLAEQALIQWVWGTHGKYSAAELRRQTHAEAPWKQARQSLSEDAPGRNPITDESLRRHFLGEYRNVCQRAGLDPDHWIAAIDDAKHGRTIPWEDVVAEFRRDVAH